MKIYTRTGDNGTTSLFSGSRVPKYHIRIESYGTIDELSSYLGLVRDLPDIDNYTIDTLINIQECLMVASAVLATEPDATDRRVPEILSTDIEFLEQQIDSITSHVPPLKAFVLPGGNIAVSHTHVARCICRRAERLTLQVQEQYGGCEMVVKYLNRLSDFLFILARKFSSDFRAKEIIWKPRL